MKTHGLVALLLLAFATTSIADEKPSKAEEKPTKVEKDAKAPDFTMSGLDGKPFKLSEKLKSGEKNIVLLFSRAHW